MCLRRHCYLLLANVDKDFDLGAMDDIAKFDDPRDKDVHTDSDDSDVPDLED